MFNYLLMSFILKLFLTRKQAMDIKRNWYIIEDKAKPTLQQLKKEFFLLKILKTVLFLEQIFYRRASPPPCTPVKKSSINSPHHKSARCATVWNVNAIHICNCNLLFWVACPIHSNNRSLFSIKLSLPAETMGGVK